MLTFQNTLESKAKNSDNSIKRDKILTRTWKSYECVIKKIEVNPPGYMSGNSKDLMDNSETKEIVVFNEARSNVDPAWTVA